MVAFAPQHRPPRPGDTITVWSHPAGLWAYHGKVVAVAVWGGLFYQIQTQRHVFRTIAAGMIGGFILHPKPIHPARAGAA